MSDKGKGANKANKKPPKTAPEDQSQETGPNVVERLQKSDLRNQCRTARILRNLGWDVEYEYPYDDDVEKKVRRCDIRATLSLGDRNKIRLMIECKYLLGQDLAIAVDPDHEFISTSDCNQAIKLRDSDFRSHLVAMPHHYLTQEIGLLHEDGMNPGKGRSSDRLYEAANQAIKPVISSVPHEYTTLF